MNLTRVSKNKGCMKSVRCLTPQGCAGFALGFTAACLLCYYTTLPSHLSGRRTPKLPNHSSGMGLSSHISEMSSSQPYNQNSENSALKLSSNNGLAQEFTKIDHHFSTDNNVVNQHQSYANRTLIYAKFRTGSSFLGRIVTQNPRTFYIFEPLFYLRPAGKDFVQENALWHLKNNFNCKFNETIHFGLSFLHSSLDAVKKKELSYWREIAYCLGNIKWPRKRIVCKPLPTSWLEAVCKDQAHVVIKVIRVRYLSLLENLMSTGVKVVHLVRDPRAVLNSRFQLSANTTTNSSDTMQGLSPDSLNTSISHSQQEMSQYCDYLRKDLQFHKLISKNSYLKKNYYFIRYEDLAMAPIKRTADLYSFLKLPMTERVLTFIKKSTESPIKPDDPYSTIRNSSAVVDRWRRELTYDLISMVQQLCGDVMTKLGYIIIPSERHVTDSRFQILRKLH